MKIIQNNNDTYVEIPCEGNENSAGWGPVHIYKWTRTPITVKTGFVVEVYVEGYRMTKDVWLYEVYDFDTLDAALTFYHKLNQASWHEQEKILDFAGYTKYNGWYGLSVEEMRVYEYTPQGKFQWQIIHTVNQK